VSPRWSFALLRTVALFMSSIKNFLPTLLKHAANILQINQHHVTLFFINYFSEYLNKTFHSQSLYNRYNFATKLKLIWRQAEF
jgi:hypothetical protein